MALTLDQIATSLQLPTPLSTDIQYRLEALQGIADNLVDGYSVNAPDPILDEAIIRIIGFLYDVDPAQTRVKNIDPLTMSGAAGLLDHFRRLEPLIVTPDWDGLVESQVITPGGGTRGPRGPKGDPGTPGKTGLQGPPGPQGPAGRDGQDYIDATHTIELNAGDNLYINTTNTQADERNQNNGWDYYRTYRDLDRGHIYFGSADGGVTIGFGPTMPAGWWCILMAEENIEADDIAMGRLFGGPTEVPSTLPRSLGPKDALYLTYQAARRLVFIDFRGVQGPEGPKGNDGPPGQDGAQGPQGARGRQGQQGPAGREGPIGPTGPQGPAGTAVGHNVRTLNEGKHLYVSSNPLNLPSNGTPQPNDVYQQVRYADCNRDMIQFHGSQTNDYGRMFVYPDCNPGWYMDFFFSSNYEENWAYVQSSKNNDGTDQIQITGYTGWPVRRGTIGRMICTGKVNGIPQMLVQFF